jgi:hypothetical protein
VQKISQRRQKMCKRRGIVDERVKMLSGMEGGKVVAGRPALSLLSKPSSLAAAELVEAELVEDVIIVGLLPQVGHCPVFR